MRKLNIFGVLLLTFLIGSFSTLIVNFFSVSKPEIGNKTLEVTKTQIVEKLIEKPKLRVFNTESFWNESEGQHNKRLLEIGEASNVEDFSVKSGEVWLGLFNEKDEDFLRLTKLKVSREKAFDLDWKKISVSEKKSPLFLVKKSKNLKDGKIKTLFHPKTWQETGEESESVLMREGFNKNFNLQKQEYILRVEKGLS